MCGRHRTSRSHRKRGLSPSFRHSAVKEVFTGNSPINPPKYPFKYEGSCKLAESLLTSRGCWGYVVRTSQGRVRAGWGLAGQLVSKSHADESGVLDRPISLLTLCDSFQETEPRIGKSPSSLFPASCLKAKEREQQATPFLRHPQQSDWKMFFRCFYEKAFIQAKLVTVTPLGH